MDNCLWGVNSIKLDIKSIKFSECIGIGKTISKERKEKAD